MSIKSDRWIRNQCILNIPETRYPEKFNTMINPFVEKQTGEGVISYGVSSYGYDIRVADEFQVFNNLHSSIIDPKKFDKALLWERKGLENLEKDESGYFVLVPPNSFALAKTVEYFKIPRNIMTICVGKSTYARCGIIVNVTPFEPEWEGYATMEISNTTPCPAKIYANEGIAQVLFFEADEVCEVSYADRKGKYQKQMELTLPKVK